MAYQPWEAKQNYRPYEPLRVDRSFIGLAITINSNSIRRIAMFLGWRLISSIVRRRRKIRSTSAWLTCTTAIAGSNLVEVRLGVGSRAACCSGFPARRAEIVWNDRDGDHFCCHILDVRSGKRRTIPHPIYTLSPDGKTGLSLDFSRLHDVRPGYGYAGVPDPYADQLAPSDTGIYRVDMQTGEQEMIISLGEIAALATSQANDGGRKHKFNHLLFSPDGSRFIFLHRWTGPKGRETRMYTATPEGKDLRLVDDNGFTSHFMWRDHSTF